jgi:YfiH family protein
VAKNRALVSHRIGARPLWLKQVHGTHVVEAADCLEADPNGAPEADASFTHRTGVACAVMTADCLPVLFCDRAGTVVGAAHAGWRGLLDGVLEATMGAMGVPADELMAYLGPAIGPQAFEVGDEVRAAFVARSRNAEDCVSSGKSRRQMVGRHLSAGPTAPVGSGCRADLRRRLLHRYRR